MDWKLELVVVPVSDVDRAKSFYAEQLGFNVDVDHRAGDDFRVVQLTPPGSACSISIGTGITDAVPGSVRGLHLVVSDIEAAHAELVQRGVGPARSSISSRANRCRDWIPNAATMARSSSSAIPTAIAGPYKK